MDLLHTVKAKMLRSSVTTGTLPSGARRNAVPPVEMTTWKAEATKLAAQTGAPDLVKV